VRNAAITAYEQAGFEALAPTLKRRAKLYVSTGISKAMACVQRSVEVLDACKPLTGDLLKRYGKGASRVTVALGAVKPSAVDDEEHDDNESREPIQSQDDRLVSPGAKTVAELTASSSKNAARSRNTRIRDFALRLVHMDHGDNPWYHSLHAGHFGWLLSWLENGNEIQAEKWNDMLDKFTFPSMSGLCPWGANALETRCGGVKPERGKYPPTADGDFLPCPQVCIR
jgi:hypothetical protein